MAPTVAPQSKPGQPQPSFLPTLAEIREACAAIQANWSVEERARRWVGRSGFDHIQASFDNRSIHGMIESPRSHSSSVPQVA